MSSADLRREEADRLLRHHPAVSTFPRAGMGSSSPLPASPSASASTERLVLERERLLIERTFATQREKPFSTVLKRCVKFVYDRVLEGYTEKIPAKAFDLRFREEIGDDRLTIKKYYGNNKRRLELDSLGKRRYFRGEHEAGAFERFGLVERITPPHRNDTTLAWRILPYFWQRLKEVYPQRKIAEFWSQHQYEGSGVKKEDISLIEAVESESEKLSANAEKETNNNNTNSERDIFFGTCLQKTTSVKLTPEEQLVLDVARKSRGDSHG